MVDVSLERLLEGLLFGPDVKISFEVLEGDKAVSGESQVFVLPLERVDGETQGLFFLNEGDKCVQRTVQLGFSVGEEFYGINEYYAINREECVAGKVYVPLVVSDVKNNLSKRVNGSWVCSDVPFSIYGVEGGIVKKVRPLVLMKDGEYKVLFQDVLGVNVYDPEPGAEFRKGVKAVLNRMQYDAHYLAFRPDDGITDVLDPVLDLKTLDDDQLLFGLDDDSDDELPALPKPMVCSDPASMIAYFDRFVVEQKRAKEMLAVVGCLYQDLVREKANHDGPKLNALLVGPTGVGKTRLVRLLAEVTDVPFESTTCTGKSGPGYVDEGLNSVMKRLSKKVSGKKPYGVVFVDEVDKIVHEHGDLFGELKNDELIGWLGGTVVSDTYGSFQLDTSNLLFVLAGAFQSGPVSLEDIVKERRGVENRGVRMGFGARQVESNYVQQGVLDADLISYGLKDELVGRLPYRVVLDPLSQADLLNIMQSGVEKSIIEGYMGLFAKRGYMLVFDDSAFVALANECHAYQTGARALEAVCAKLFRPLLVRPQEFAEEVSGEKIISITGEKVVELLKE